MYGFDRVGQWAVEEDGWVTGNEVYVSIKWVKLLVIAGVGM